MPVIAATQERCCFVAAEIPGVASLKGSHFFIWWHTVAACCTVFVLLPLLSKCYTAFVLRPLLSKCYTAFVLRPLLSKCCTACVVAVSLSQCCTAYFAFFPFTLHRLVSVSLWKYCAVFVVPVSLTKFCMPPFSCMSIRALLLLCFLIRMLRRRLSLFCYHKLHRLSWPSFLIRLFCLSPSTLAVIWSYCRKAWLTSRFQRHCFQNPRQQISDLYISLLSFAFLVGQRLKKTVMETRNYLRQFCFLLWF